MKKEYIQPMATDVTAQLGADILGDETLGQSYVPTGGADREDVDFSGKQNPFFEEDEEDAAWPKTTNVWDK